MKKSSKKNQNRLLNNIQQAPPQPNGKRLNKRIKKSLLEKYSFQDHQLSRSYQQENTLLKQKAQIQNVQRFIIDVKEIMTFSKQFITFILNVKYQIEERQVIDVYQKPYRKNNNIIHTGQVKTKLIHGSMIPNQNQQFLLRIKTKQQAISSQKLSQITAKQFQINKIQFSMIRIYQNKTQGKLIAKQSIIEPDENQQLSLQFKDINEPTTDHKSSIKKPLAQMKFQIINLAKINNESEYNNIESGKDQQQSNIFNRIQQDEQQNKESIVNTKKQSQAQISQSQQSKVQKQKQSTSNINNSTSKQRDQEQQNQSQYQQQNQSQSQKQIQQQINQVQVSLQQYTSENKLNNSGSDNSFDKRYTGLMQSNQYISQQIQPIEQKFLNNSSQIPQQDVQNSQQQQQDQQQEQQYSKSNLQSRKSNVIKKLNQLTQQISNNLQKSKNQDNAYKNYLDQTSQFLQKITSTNKINNQNKNDSQVKQKYQHYDSNSNSRIISINNNYSRWIPSNLSKINQSNSKQTQQNNKSNQKEQIQKANKAEENKQISQSRCLEEILKQMQKKWHQQKFNPKQKDQNEDILQNQQQNQEKQNKSQKNIAIQFKRFKLKPHQKQFYHNILNYFKQKHRKQKEQNNQLAQQYQQKHIVNTLQLKIKQLNPLKKQIQEVTGQLRLQQKLLNKLLQLQQVKSQNQASNIKSIENQLIESIQKQMYAKVMKIRIDLNDIQKQEDKQNRFHKIQISLTPKNDQNGQKENNQYVFHLIGMLPLHITGGTQGKQFQLDDGVKNLIFYDQKNGQQMAKMLFQIKKGSQDKEIQTLQPLINYNQQYQQDQIDQDAESSIQFIGKEQNSRRNSAQNSIPKNLYLNPIEKKFTKNQRNNSLSLSISVLPNNKFQQEKGSILNQFEEESRINTESLLKSRHDKSIIGKILKNFIQNKEIDEKFQFRGKMNPSKQQNDSLKSVLPNMNIELRKLDKVKENNFIEPKKSQQQKQKQRLIEIKNILEQNKAKNKEQQQNLINQASKLINLIKNKTQSLLKNNLNQSFYLNSQRKSQKLSQCNQVVAYKIDSNSRFEQFDEQKLQNKKKSKELLKSKQKEKSKEKEKSNQKKKQKSNSKENKNRSNSKSKEKKIETNRKEKAPNIQRLSQNDKKKIKNKNIKSQQNEINNLPISSQYSQDQLILKTKLKSRYKGTPIKTVYTNQIFQSPLPPSQRAIQSLNKQEDSQLIYRYDQNSDQKSSQISPKNKNNSFRKKKFQKKREINQNSQFSQRNTPIQSAGVITSGDRYKNYFQTQIQQSNIQSSKISSSVIEQDKKKQTGTISDNNFRQNKGQNLNESFYPTSQVQINNLNMKFFQNKQLKQKNILITFNKIKIKLLLPTSIKSQNKIKYSQLKYFQDFYLVVKQEINNHEPEKCQNTIITQSKTLKCLELDSDGYYHFQQKTAFCKQIKFQGNQTTNLKFSLYQLKIVSASKQDEIQLITLVKKAPNKLKTEKKIVGQLQVSFLQLIAQKIEKYDSKSNFTLALKPTQISYTNFLYKGKKIRAKINISYDFIQEKHLKTQVRNKQKRKRTYTLSSDHLNSINNNKSSCNQSSATYKRKKSLGNIDRSRIKLNNSAQEHNQITKIRIPMPLKLNGDPIQKKKYSNQSINSSLSNKVNSNSFNNISNKNNKILSQNQIEKYGKKVYALQNYTDDYFQDQSPNKNGGTQLRIKKQMKKQEKMDSIKRNSILVRQEVIQKHQRLGGNIKFGKSSRFNSQQQTISPTRNSRDVPGPGHYQIKSIFDRHSIKQP